MKLFIFICLLLFNSSLFAQKIEGLFGIKIGEVLTKELMDPIPDIIGFDLKSLENITSMQELKMIKEKVSNKIKRSRTRNNFVRIRRQRRRNFNLLYPADRTHKNCARYW